MLKDYYDARKWLESFIPQIYSRKELNLDRIKYLLRLLGNPEKKFESIHVGGTAGKGSTAFYISQLLQQKKIKVGLHLSPHLIYLGERMQINGKKIPIRRFVGLINEIKPFVEQMRASQVGKPSYFEILVAASFKYFADEKVDFAVVEVGLGGKFDATNVLAPKVSVITNVGLDHTEFLGETVEKIAKEKAGIIKKNIPVVTGASRNALEIIEKVAKKQKSKLYTIDTLFEKNSLNSDTLKPFDLYKEIVRDSRSKLAFSNQLLAFLTIFVLKFQFNKNHIESMFSKTLAGRIEVIERDVILDGAHNPDKIQFLIDFVRNSKLETRNSKVVLVIAFKQGKNWKKMVDMLIKNLPVKKVIATQFNAVTDTGMFAAVDAEEIAKYVNSKWKMVNSEVVKNSQEAVVKALNSTQLPIYPTTQLAIVTGSLYLVGEARTLWKLPEF